ncbi:MAG: type 4a pilus biogenesis protein PilO [Bacillota bacterium]
MAKPIKISLICLSVFVLAAVVYYLAVEPLQQKAVDTAEKASLAQIRLNQIKDKVAKLGALEKSLREAGPEEEAFENSIPADRNLAVIYDRIDYYASRSGFKVKQITAANPFKPFNGNKQLQYIPLTIEGTAYFPQIIHFFDLVAGGTLLLRIENFEMTGISKGRNPRIAFKIVLHAFEYTDGVNK